MIIFQIITLILLLNRFASTRIKSHPLNDLKSEETTRSAKARWIKTIDPGFDMLLPRNSVDSQMAWAFDDSVPKSLREAVLEKIKALLKLLDPTGLDEDQILKKNLRNGATYFFGLPQEFTLVSNQLFLKMLQMDYAPYLSKENLRYQLMMLERSYISEEIENENAGASSLCDCDLHIISNEEAKIILSQLVRTDDYLFSSSSESKSDRFKRAPVFDSDDSEGEEYSSCEFPENATVSVTNLHPYWKRIQREIRDHTTYLDRPKIKVIKRGLIEWKFISVGDEHIGGILKAAVAAVGMIREVLNILERYPSLPLPPRFKKPHSPALSVFSDFFPEQDFKIVKSRLKSVLQRKIVSIQGFTLDCPMARILHRRSVWPGFAYGQGDRRVLLLNMNERWASLSEVDQCFIMLKLLFQLNEELHDAFIFERRPIMDGLFGFVGDLYEATALKSLSAKEPSPLKQDYFSTTQSRNSYASYAAMVLSIMLYAKSSEIEYVHSTSLFH